MMPMQRDATDLPAMLATLSDPHRAAVVQLAQSLAACEQHRPSGACTGCQVPHATEVATACAPVDAGDSEDYPTSEAVAERVRRLDAKRAASTDDGMPKQRARRGDWMQTTTGIKFWPFDPHPDDVCMIDITRALSNICRFGGHAHEFYSVAQHSVLVSRIVPREHALIGLMHDAAEAYIGDMIRPIKTWCGMDSYRELEAIVWKAMSQALSIRYTHPSQFPECVKRADMVALATEARDIMGGQIAGKWNLDADPLPERIVPLMPNEAEILFRDRFLELCEKGDIR